MVKHLNQQKNKISLQLKKQLVLLKSELLKNSGAEKATSNFYNNVINEENIQLNKTIYRCFSKPRMVLDSVCYVRMINE